MALRFANTIRKFALTALQQSSAKNALGHGNLVSAVAVTNDGKTIVAWHADTDIAYESTRPIPKAVEVQTGSIIKDAALNSAMRAFKEKHPEVARQELMQLTHTTKHRWFPRARDKRAKGTPMDRPYL